MNGILLNELNEIIITLKRDSDGMIISGIEIGDIDYQRTRLIMEMQKGEIKQYPALGFGVDNYIKSTDGDTQKFINELQKQLKSDNLKAKVRIEKGKFEVEV